MIHMRTIYLKKKTFSSLLSFGGTQHSGWTEFYFRVSPVVYPTGWYLYYPSRLLPFKSVSNFEHTVGLIVFRSRKQVDKILRSRYLNLYSVGLVRREKNLNSVGSEKMFSSFRQYISHNNICILRTEEPYVVRVKAVNQLYSVKTLKIGK